MALVLTAEEIRVLGCLIEKKITTPDYYPLSVNSLLNACNQKSNRQPVVAYEESDVLRALDELKTKNLMEKDNWGRVTKYKEAFVARYNFDSKPDQVAILCLLFLRGPQTAGELRGRTERLHAFANLEEVNDSLEALILENYVARLERQPGRKEVRYCHLLSPLKDDIIVAADAPKEVFSNSEAATMPKELKEDRLTMLEAQVKSLTAEVEELRQNFLDFQKKFE